MEISQKVNIIVLWILWQFYEMPKFLLQIWKNYLMFVSNYFSVGQLLKTLFSPWRRYSWKYPRGLDLKEFFNTLISNTFSRVLGAGCRVLLIVLGIFSQIFVVLAGLIIFICWILIPFIIIAGFLFVFTF